MANFPTDMRGQWTSSPGMHGQQFGVDMPGYHDQNAERINRTNMQLSVCEHDVPNVKYEMDRRLRKLFDFGFSTGYNQIAIPKGRIVSVDPTLNLLDYDTHKVYNTLTLANGGTPVKLSANRKKWEPIQGLDAAYVEIAPGEKVYRAMAKTKTELMTEHKLSFDSKTGYLTVDGVVTDEIIPANIPFGVIQRNEYTRDYDAFNGMQPSPIITDKLIELPMFLLKEKAEMNPWGSAYGQLLPGDYVKSDENGRFVVSPLSRLDELKAKTIELTAAEMEKERQQIVGQVFEVSRDLIPAGAARFATWALSDRLNFDGFNPLLWPRTNRQGEDVVDHTPYVRGGQNAINSNTNMTGVDPVAGWPYDNTMSYNDLHLLESTARRASNRMPQEYQYENLGIPGLTDGYNAVVRPIGPELCGTFKNASSPSAFIGQLYQLTEVQVEKGIEIAVTEKNANQLLDTDFVSVTVDGQVVLKNGTDDILKAGYVDNQQGIFRLDVANAEKAFAFLGSKVLNVFVRYKKRGMAGVPTFLDWDGCTGKVSILLQK